MSLTANEAYVAASAIFPEHDGRRFGLSGASDGGWTVSLTDEAGRVLKVILVDAEGNAEEASAGPAQMSGAVGIEY
tara:strand:+ start:372 stop:599 length:228 start_codon:yes stop_codon:yes gene_type:complete